MIALIDGDALLYKAGFAVEYKHYYLEDMYFRHKRSLDAYLEWNYDEDEAELLSKSVSVREIKEPIQNAYHLLNLMIESIMKATDAQEKEIYVGGEHNFRSDVEYPVKYKGNRKDKPSYIGELKEFLIKNYDAKVCVNVEADDMLGIRQTELSPNSIICSIDKDLKQVPGFYYHLDNKVVTLISQEIAARSFWEQMLTGDRTDNIIGLKGVGPKTAFEELRNLNTEEEFSARVKELYKEEFKERADKMYHANYRLLRILRSLDEAR